MDIILASKSPYRKQQLLSAGFHFQCVPSAIDEQQYKDRDLSPAELSRELSFAKAQVVQRTHPESLIIGSDQVAHLQGLVLNKPKSAEKNIEQLKRLNGKTHQLVTSVCCLTPSEKFELTVVTELTMKTLTEQQLVDYVNEEQAFDCAGGYKVEALGIHLFEKIETEDFTSIMGLPMIRLSEQINQLCKRFPFETSGDKL